ncbi:MAG: REP-associated tyrosine transposase [Bacteroidia bacterium]
MSRKYKFHTYESIYFISFATVKWVNVFEREAYCNILISCLNFCVEQKGMEIFAWCLMPNHVHILFRSTIQRPSDLIRDLKSFTSKQILKTIEETETDERKESMLKIFSSAGLTNSNNKQYQFWQQDNQPLEIYSSHFFAQKLNYIHQNPVRANLVNQPDQWQYSSAKNYSGQKGLVKITLI